VVPVQPSLSTRTAETGQFSGPDLTKTTEALFPFSWSTAVSAETAGLCPLVRHFSGESVGNTACRMGLLQSVMVVLKISNQTGPAYTDTGSNLWGRPPASLTTRTIRFSLSIHLTSRVCLYVGHRISNG
jgi:hypothetical protein